MAPVPAASLSLASSSVLYTPSVSLPLSELSLDPSERVSCGRKCCLLPWPSFRKAGGDCQVVEFLILRGSLQHRLWEGQSLAVSHGSPARSASLPVSVFPTLICRIFPGTKGHRCLSGSGSGRNPRAPCGARTQRSVSTLPSHVKRRNSLQARWCPDACWRPIGSCLTISSGNP